MDRQPYTVVVSSRRAQDPLGTGRSVETFWVVVHPSSGELGGAATHVETAELIRKHWPGVPVAIQWPDSSRWEISEAGAVSQSVSPAQDRL